MTTPALGLGSSPLGASPYGFGTPATAAPNGGSINRLPNGLQTGSPKISLGLGTSGQYEFDEFGRRVGQGDVEHMVTLALGTVRGTCVVPQVGHRFREVRKVSDSFADEMKVRVQEALGPLLDGGLISVDDVAVDPARGQPSRLVVRVTDLSTGQQIQRII